MWLRSPLAPFDARRRVGLDVGGSREDSPDVRGRALKGVRTR